LSSCLWRYAAAAAAARPPSELGTLLCWLLKYSFIYSTFLYSILAPAIWPWPSFFWLRWCTSGIQKNLHCQSIFVAQLLFALILHVRMFHITATQ
jgi:hypothetical protein